MGEVRIKKERLLRWLEELSHIGRNEGTGGIDRQLGSPADSEARAWLTRLWQEDLGLSVHTDAIANLWGHSPEEPEGEKPIVIGSHHDSVPNGGAYDGALGVLVATEVKKTIEEHQLRLRHPLVLLSFTGEEPSDFSVSTLGSKVLCGRLVTEDLRKLRNPVTEETLSSAIRRLGGDVERAAEARLQKGSMAAFMECHIEQGRRLYDAGEAVAAVSCITGIYREIITVEGEANHAGTTCYLHRCDALAAASDVVLAVENIMKNPKLDGVSATVGRLDVQPGAMSIVPGRAELSLDLRTADPVLREKALSYLGTALKEIEMRRSVKIRREVNLNQQEMPMDPEVIQALKDGAAAIGERPQELVSMAGHDAANMARLTRAGMLFVQSIEGYSHCPQEATGPEEIGKAAQNFLEAVLLLDRRLD